MFQLLGKKWLSLWVPKFLLTLKLSKNIQSTAKKVLTQEAEAILQVSAGINSDFEACVEHLLSIPGRIVFTGIGKSAIIAQKIVATMNSTGTPALFMHAADAIHGDLGMIQAGDSVICISKSGDTPEIKVLVPLIKRTGVSLIAMVSNKQSYLGQQADYVLNTYVEQEACPNNLAPTTSTTAQLVIGDALAVCLLDLRGFSSKDFAKYHPGGALGKRLYLRVSDLSSVNQKPKVSLNTNIKDIIVEITEKMLGVAAVVEDNIIVGIITDGDLRRMLSKSDSFLNFKAKDIMSSNPKRIDEDAMAIDAMELMETHGISQLLVENNGTYAGVVHLHDLIKEGII